MKAARTALLTVALGALAAPGAASAVAPTCGFAGSTVSINDDDGSAITIQRGGAGPGAQIQWAHGGSPLAQCGAATVDNTDLIGASSSTGTQASLNIDLSGGAFAPGATSEAPGASEIEIISANFQVQVTGSAGADSLRAGPAGLDLNRDSETLFDQDQDVTFDGNLPNKVVFYGQDGNDTFSGQGIGAITPTPTSRPLFLSGGGDGDSLTGGSGDDTLSGQTSIGPGNSDTADSLSGGAGNDVLDGGPGDDGLQGGPGIDTGNFSNTPSAATVDLRITTPQPTGQGNDTLGGIENLFGSAFPGASDSLTGDDAPNRIDGQDGNDLIDGQGAQDTLLGGNGANSILARDGGPDAVSCGAGTDAVTADQQGVDTIASDCEGVDFLAAPAADIGGTPPGGPGGGAGRDTTVALSLTAPHTQHVLRRKGVLATAGCGAEACAASATATIALPRRGRVSASRRTVKAFALGPVRSTLPAGQRTAIMLALRKKQLEALRRALPRTGSELTGVVRVAVKDAAGNSAARSARITVKR
jgi:Ca2+-binding RTX toxin-like protein